MPVFVHVFLVTTIVMLTSQTGEICGYYRFVVCMMLTSSCMWFITAWTRCMWFITAWTLCMWFITTWTLCMWFITAWTQCMHFMCTWRELFPGDFLGLCGLLLTLDCHRATVVQFFYNFSWCVFEIFSFLKK